MAISFMDQYEERFARTPSVRLFYESLTLTERNYFGHLWSAVMALASGAEETAALTLEALVRWMPDEEDGSGSLSVRTFAEALLGRIAGKNMSGGNLYLGARPPGAQLRAFELLRLRTPLIPFAYAAGNRALLESIPEDADVTIVDIGIGRAGQIRSLMRNPNALGRIRSLHVIGIEPDSHVVTGAGALEMARENVLATAQEVDLPTTFTGIAKLAEDLTAADILAAEPRGLVVGQSAFSLHHVLDGPGARPGAGRRRVLSVLAEAGVTTVVLVEPDSNHSVDDLCTRALFAFRHYTTLLRCLFASLAPSDAQLVWQEFFAPEVRNVIACEGTSRVERHEETSRWVEHLMFGGYVPDLLNDLVPSSVAPTRFAVLPQDTGFKLLYGDVSLIGVVRGSLKA